MFVNEQNKRKIIACLEAGDLVKDIKAKTRCTIYEINSVIKELGDEFSSNYNLELYEKVMARENAYKEEQEKLKEQAIVFLEQNVNIEEVKKKTNLTQDEIREILNALKKSGPEGEVRYQKIQENLAKQKEEKEMLERKLDEEIIALLLDNVKINQIIVQKRVTKFRIKKILKRLKEENFELYLEIKNSQKNKTENISLDREDPNIYIARLILENDLLLEHTALQIMLPPTKLYDNLIAITDEPIKAELQPILESFKKQWMNKTDKSKKSVKDYPPSIRKDIILTALTYRIPIELMPYLFNTTIDDIYELYISFDEHREALIYVNKETRYESEESRNKNYERAAEYWQVYNNLAKLLNEIRKQKKEMQKALTANTKENILEQITIKNQKIEEVKERLKQHHTLIGNEIIEGIISKKFPSLTIEEREAVARYRLKYYLPIKKAAEMLHLDVPNIRYCEEELAEKDQIYAEKLNILNGFYAKYHQKKQSEYRKTYFQNINELETIIKKNLETEKTLDYFHFAVVNPYTESDIENKEFNRGGGTR